MINNFISRIILNNFRNYNNKIIDFFEDFNVIVAPNGYGKTNILESISLFNDLANSISLLVLLPIYLSFHIIRTSSQMKR